MDILFPFAKAAGNAAWDMEAYRDDWHWPGPRTASTTHPVRATGRGASSTPSPRIVAAGPVGACHRRL